LALGFQPSIELKWRGMRYTLETPDAATAFLRGLPDDCRRGNDYENARAACHRAAETNRLSDLDAARTAVLVFTDKLIE
jgi:hypothetical protein